MDFLGYEEQIESILSEWIAEAKAYWKDPDIMFVNRFSQIRSNEYDQGKYDNTITQIHKLCWDIARRKDWIEAKIIMQKEMIVYNESKIKKEIGAGCLGDMQYIKRLRNAIEHEEGKVATKVEAQEVIERARIIIYKAFPGLNKS